jgi:formylglycine-generating enzyme
MTSTRLFQTLFSSIAIVLVLPKCASPTALTVTVYSEIPCLKKPVAGLSAAQTTGELRTKALATTSGVCGADGKLGSVVLYPIERADGPVAVQIVVRPDGEDPATCTEQNGYRGCIVARRELRFAPNKNVELRVDMRLSCLDKPCDAASTCTRGVCVNASVQCDASPCDEDALPVPQADGGTKDDASDGESVRDAGTDAPPPAFPAQSCTGLPATCGPAKNEDCCATRLVTGGTFFRSYDGVTNGHLDKSFPAEISTFYLDRFETTLGRFANFLKGYPANIPAAGAGKNPSNAADTGWTGQFRLELAAVFPDAATASARIQEARGTIGLANPGNPNEPVTAIPWAAAIAFCIWDGGRLPTEAEWNYAAAGGSEQRVFPWSSPPSDVTIGPTYAHVAPATPFLLLSVGSLSPTGDSRYGQADMTGNAWEWTLGPSGGVPYTVPCKDCVQYPPSSVASLRGGSYREDYTFALNAHREQSGSSSRNASFGFRCARNK